MSKPLIISFYTKESLYKRDAELFIKSCKKFNLEYEVEAVSSKGSWEKNCAYKPTFVLEKLLAHKRPVVWVDIDAEFLKPPELFDSLACDLSARIHENLEAKHPSKVLSGTVFVNYSERAIALLKLWAKECETCDWDQIGLRNTLLSQKIAANVFPLPANYCAIFDKEKTDQDKAVILHYQASRYYKKMINKEVVPFWKEENFPIDNYRKKKS